MEKLGLPDRVLANLWMSTAAEDEACCLATFNVAYEKIQARVKNPAAATDGKPAAIVTDLDATVMDNSLFDSFLAIHGRVFSEELWDGWEVGHAGDTRLVPGAGEFIAKVRALGVEVIFISNRSEKNRAQTIESLIHLGLIRSAEEVSGENRLRLLLTTLSSSKESRREQVREKYQVIAYLGDALGDFSADFDKDRARTLDERRAAVRAHADQWGEEWFMLPNPVYGQWERPLDLKNARDHLPRIPNESDLSASP